jgi:hypothetical protein
MTIKKDQWVWIIVYNQDGNEQMLGQHDSGADISFIPCFLTKEEAVNGLSHLIKNTALTYMFQAILHEDLQRYAGNNGFWIFVLKASGEIIEKLSP